MYKKCYAQRLKDNTYLIHLWEDEGYSKIEWTNQAYAECDEADASHTGLNGEPLRKVRNWKPDNPKLHFHDMTPYQKFLIEKYGINDEPSVTHRGMFFDIETEMGDALTEDYIKSAPKKVTSIAWYDKQVDLWGILILDAKNQINHTKAKNKEIIPCRTDAIGEKYAGINKIEYEGSLDRLFETDVNKFIQYNFRDVEILKVLDEKLEYLALVKNLSHKGKHNYSEVYANTKTQDGAISAYLLSEGLVPPAKDRNPLSKKNYAGGYLFCPKAGIYKYMFDEDLTSLYPSIIMTVNIGKETMVGRIIDADDRNNRLGLNDLLARDPNEELIIENAKRKRTKIKVGGLVNLIKDMKMAVSANGVFFRTDKESVLSTILKKWFDERVLYKNEMKKAYKELNDPVLGASFHMKQYTMKILLNSLYGATALGSFRYGNVILSEAITLSGQRIIQESALAANRHMNKVIKDEISL